MDAIRSILKKKYASEGCHNCVPINGTMKSFIHWLLLSDNTTLSHSYQIGSSVYTGSSLHLYFTCLWTNSDHPSGGHIILGSMVIH